MSAELLNPPPHLPPAATLKLSQQAPRILQSSPTTSIPYPLSLLTASDTQETWAIYENLVLSCLRTGDDKSARLCLDRLSARFGERNERIMSLRGLYEESVALDTKALEAVLREYEEVLKEDPTNMPMRKRRIALLRSMGKSPEATTALVGLLDVSPTDAEAWSELSDLYLTQGLYQQAIFSLEEVLLIIPNAWNIQARLGEILFLGAIATNSPDGNTLKGITESMRRFCRSIELCDNYLRGYYGLKLTSKKLLELLSKSSRPSSATSDPQTGDLAPPSVSTIQKLNEVATSKLAEIVRRSSTGETGWDGYEEGEVIAARELLGRDTQGIER